MVAVVRVARLKGKRELAFEARHERDLELCKRRGGHPRGLWFNEAAGERVVEFVEKYCRHFEGEWAGKPVKLEEWQKHLLRVAFGWMRADGTRRFRTVYVEIARKNGKSFLTSALGLYLLVADGEPGAQVYSSATKRDQARIVWKGASKMVEKSPELGRFAKVFQNSIVVKRSDSFFQPLSAESNTLDGLNPHGNIVDELHAHKDRGVWDVLDSAMGARRQPMTVAITTAGVFDQTSIGWEQHDYACNVLDGTIEDDDFFAFVAAPDEGDDVMSVEAHQKANPNYDVSIKGSYLAKQAKKAKDQPGFFNEYSTKHVNVWAQQVKRWLPMEQWNECEEVVPLGTDLRALALAHEASLEGKVCRGGLDLSSKLDLTALVLEFQDGDWLRLVCRFWIPEARVALVTDRGQKHYSNWVKDGWLVATPGDVIDYAFVEEEVKVLSKRYRIRELAFDPWGSTDLANRLANVEGMTMVEVRQGYKTLSEPSKDVQARVVQRRVNHARHPVMRWCASNAVVTTDAAGNIKPDKEKAIEKIDGIVAWVMARSRGIVVKEERGSLLLDVGGVILG